MKAMTGTQRKCLRFTTELDKRIKEIVEHLGVTENSFIIMALNEYIDMHTKKNNTKEDEKCG